MKINVRKYTKFTDDGNVQGISDIDIEVGLHNLTISGVKVVRGKNGIFYAMPQRSYVDSAGEKKYASVCAFYTADGYKEFHKAMTEGFTKYFNEHVQMNQSVFEQDIPKSAAYSREEAFDKGNFGDDDIPF